MPTPIKVPTRGAANARPFVAPPDQFAPASTLRNFFPHDVDGDRLRGGTRPGTRALFDTVMGAGRPVQALFTVTRAAQVSGYVVPPPGDGYEPVRSLLGGRSAPAGALAGNLFAVNNVPSFEWAQTLAGQGGPASVSVSALAVSRNGVYFAAACNHVVAGLTRATVELRRVDTGELVWSWLISSGSASRSVNSLFFSTDAVWACTSAGLMGRYIADNTDVPLPNDPLSGRSPADFYGWGSQAVAGKCIGAGPGGTERMYVAFDGTTLGNPGLVGPYVAAGHYASQFRSGVMQFATNVRGSFSGLSQVTYGGAAGQVAYQEGQHGYWRVSERSAYAPRGCRVTAMDVSGVDGTVVIARTNVGCGPSNAFEPDGTIVPAVGLALINANSSLRWESDSTGTILEAGLLGYLNDCPVTGGSGVTNEPSLTCVKFDPAGDVYAAGRFNGGSVSAFKVRGADGSRLWAANITGSGAVIRAVAIDPTDNNPVFVGDRNNSSGSNAHLWKLNALTGAVIASLDLPSAASARAVAATPSGVVIYGSDQI